MKKILYYLLFVGSSLSIPTGTFEEFVEFFSRAPFEQLSFEDRCKTFCETVIAIDRLFDIFPELKCNKVCEDASEFSSQYLISAIANNDYDKVYYFLESPYFQEEWVASLRQMLLNTNSLTGKKILLLFLRKKTDMSHLYNARTMPELSQIEYAFSNKIYQIVNYNLSKK